MFIAGVLRSLWLRNAPCIYSAHVISARFEQYHDTSDREKCQQVNMINPEG